MDFSFKEEEEEFGFDHFLFDDVFFQVPEERNQLKRGAKEISENNLPQNTNDSDRSFPEKVLGQQIKEKTNTSAVSKRTSIYLSAIMEDIAKYVLDEAGKDKDKFILPESRCIRVDDVEKVLSSANLLALDSEVLSRSFLFGTSICVDSINEKLLLRVIESITNSFADFVDVQLLPVNPSPLLQDSILCHHASHEIVLSMAYCERVSTAFQFLSNSKQLLLVPRSLRLLLAVLISRGKENHASLMLLRSYVNSFHSRCLFTLDLFLDCDDNACFYAEYNAYRKNKAAGKDVSCASSIQTHLFTLEIEQFVCFKVLSDLLKGRWIVPIPRYCKPEPWEFEQMMKVATGKVQPFERCSVSLEFEVKSLDMEGKVVLSDQQSVLKKYNTLKRFEYVSPWHGEGCKDQNKTVLCNLALLCFCPIEIIPVLYHYLYYQCHILFYTPLPDNHPSIRNIVELLRGSIL